MKRVKSLNIFSPIVLVFSLQLWGIGKLPVQYCRAMTSVNVPEKVLARVTNTSYGSERLGAAWTGRSLVHCVWSCLSKYSSGCQTVMYNSDTNLCTPGSFHKTLREGAALAPTSTEGDLYAPVTCDTSDMFQVLSSTEASACALISNVTLDYYDASDFCLSLGAHLFTARSMEKLALLPGGERFLIGLTDLQVEGMFAWDDNGEWIEPGLASLLFKSGEPSNTYGIEHCVSVGPNSTRPSGSDIPCQVDRFRFACERPVLT